MVLAFETFLRRSRSARAAGSDQVFTLWSRSTVRGISKLGDPRRPVFVRTGPSIGTITFVARRQLSPTLAFCGKKTLLPRKASAPIETGESRKEVLEFSELIIHKPSETSVPGPTRHISGMSCSCASPKLTPVCTHGSSRYPTSFR
jgi:hypothetical protein